MAASGDNPTNRIIFLNFYLRNGYLQWRLCEVFRLEGDDMVEIPPEIFWMLAFCLTSAIQVLMIFQWQQINPIHVNFKVTLSHGCVESRNSHDISEAKHNLMGPTIMTSDNNNKDLVLMLTSYWSLLSNKTCLWCASSQNQISGSACAAVKNFGHLPHYVGARNGDHFVDISMMVSLNSHMIMR